MRPARFAREIQRLLAEWETQTIGFNEARAFCAGNCWPAGRRRRPAGCFNEARAFCAGNFGSTVTGLVTCAALQ